MHIVFCIDDNPRFLRLLQVAVRSLREQMGESVPYLCVYAGEKEEVLQTLAAENIPVSRYKPMLTKELIPPQFHASIGCFLKLELALVPELAHDDYILYCDVDVMFSKDISELLEEKPPYMGMAREYTAPFFHEYEKLSYTWRQKEYVVPMPFPIWTFSSGVVIFNLQRLRKLDYVYNFLEFCKQNLEFIGNLDQSLFNYFFGKRITLLSEKWNRPPYQADAATEGHIIHFHGPKPWDLSTPELTDLRINCFEQLRQKWFSYLTPQEYEEVQGWTKADKEHFSKT